MVAGPRRVVWAESAEKALDEILNYIALTSLEGAKRVLLKTLDTASSLATLSERGRIVPEIQDTMLRELFVHDYRMIYRVHPEYVVIEAFVHGARDFSKWHREEIPDL